MTAEGKRPKLPLTMFKKRRGWWYRLDYPNGHRLATGWLPTNDVNTMKRLIGALAKEVLGVPVAFEVQLARTEPTRTRTRRPTSNRDDPSDSSVREPEDG